MKLCLENNFDEIGFFFWVHRYLMDVYTCCRILKHDADEKWYKNMVVYAGANHSINCMQIMQAHGLKIFNIDLKNRVPAPQPPFQPGSFANGTFYPRDSAMPSIAEEGFMDRMGQFFKGRVPLSS